LSFADHWRLRNELRAQDGYDAARFLARQPFVRADEMGLIGRSGGGTAVLAAVAERVGQRRSLPFKMAVADYGYCQHPYGDWRGGTHSASGPKTAYRSAVPLLVAIGSRDDHVPATSCEALVASARSVGSPVSLLVFPGAGHAFDTLYGNATPQQQAEIVNAIASMIEKDVAVAPNGSPIHVTTADFTSHVGSDSGTLIVQMHSQTPGGTPGRATLSGRSSGGISYSVNLAEGATPRLFAQIREGTCARLYPHSSYDLGRLVNGANSGSLSNVRLGELLNGHFAVVTVATPTAATVVSCGNIGAS
jgi:dienelactone hydrolase